MQRNELRDAKAAVRELNATLGNVLSRLAPEERAELRMFYRYAAQHVGR